jgi:hypothetical protein
MILIEGPHGGGSHVENIIGGTVFIVVNVTFYFFILKCETHERLILLPS